MKATARTVFLLIITATCCFLFSLGTFAKVYTGTEENYSWSVDLNTGDMTISGDGAMADYVNHEEVTYSKFLPLIKTLTVEEGITSIGSCAFMYASSLESVCLPDSLTQIGQSAFEYCFKLKDIELPASLSSIDDMAFASCQTLEDVVLPQVLENLGAYAFSDCTSLEQINLPTSITTLSPGTFSGCTSLVSVMGLENVSVIEEAAFYGCQSVDFDTFSKSVAIATRVFFGCTSLETFVPADAYSADGAFFNTSVSFGVKWNIGTKIETGIVGIGEMPTYYGTPVKDSVLEGIYLFDAWNKPFVAATTPQNEYTAIFRLATPILLASYTLSQETASVTAELDLSGITPENAYVLFACYDTSLGMISSKRVAVSKSDTSAFAELSLRGRPLSHIKAFIYIDKACLTPLGESVIAMEA